MVTVRKIAAGFASLLILTVPGINKAYAQQTGDATNQKHETEIRGTVEAVFSDHFIVNGVTIAVSAETAFFNPQALVAAFADITVGSFVEVKAVRNTDGSLVAVRVVIKNKPDNGPEVEVRGKIERLDPNSLTVLAITFQVDSNTVICGDDDAILAFSNLFVGQSVEVKGLRQPDSSLLAIRIKIEDEDEGEHHGDDDDAHKNEIEITGSVSAVGDSFFVVKNSTFFVSASTTFDGEEHRAFTFGDLTVGAVVEVHAIRRADGTLLATRVELDDAFDAHHIELRGTIEAISEDSLIIAGVTFLIDSSIVVFDNHKSPITLADLQVGQLVEVRAVRQADGRLLATRIKREDHIDDEVEVTGAIESLSDSAIVVLGQKFTVTSNTSVFDNHKSPIPYASLAVGNTVEIRGDLLATGELVAIRIKLEDKNANEISVTGPIAAVDASSITVLGTTFAIDANTVILDKNKAAITAADLQAGQTVEIKGVAQATGTNLALRIKIEDVVVILGKIGVVTDNLVSLPSMSFVIDANTLILSNTNTALQATSLAVGQLIEIRGTTTSSTNPTLATMIKVQATNTVTTGTKAGDAVPTAFHLEQNYPNPFNPTTTIAFEIPDLGRGAVRARVVIYNLLGQKVRTLVDAALAPAAYQRVWDGRDDRGNLVPTGIYFYRLSAAQTVQTRRMTFSK